MYQNKQLKYKMSRKYECNKYLRSFRRVTNTCEMTIFNETSCFIYFYEKNIFGFYLSTIVVGASINYNQRYYSGYNRENLHNFAYIMRAYHDIKN